MAEPGSRRAGWQSRAHKGWDGGARLVRVAMVQPGS